MESSQTSGDRVSSMDSIYVQQNLVLEVNQWRYWPWSVPISPDIGSRDAVKLVFDDPHWCHGTLVWVGRSQITVLKEQMQMLILFGAKRYDKCPSKPSMNLELSKHAHGPQLRVQRQRHFSHSKCSLPRLRQDIASTSWCDAHWIVIPPIWHWSLHDVLWPTNWSMKTKETQNNTTLRQEDGMSNIQMTLTKMYEH